MTCREAERMVMPYINGELTLDEQEQFLEHIFACEDCADELEIYYTIQIGLEQLEGVRHSTNDIQKLLSEDIENSMQRIYRSKVLWAAHVFICAVTAVCIAAALALQVMEWSGYEAKTFNQTTEWESSL